MGFTASLPFQFPTLVVCCDGRLLFEDSEGDKPVEGECFLPTLATAMGNNRLYHDPCQFLHMVLR